MPNNPEEDVSSEVRSGLHRVIPARYVANLHQDILVRRRGHEEPLDADDDSFFGCSWEARGVADVKIEMVFSVEANKLDVPSALRHSSDCYNLNEIGVFE